MKILYATTVSGTINAFLIPHIRVLVENGNQVDVLYKINGGINSEILDLGCEIYDIDFSRSLFRNNIIKLVSKVREIIVTNNYDIVHTHTPIASAIVRLACKNLKKVKVIYTAHGFHFFSGAPKMNWLTFYPIEKMLSKYTDTIITINKEDYNRANRKFKLTSIEYIPGVGLDTGKFKNNKVNKKKLREEIGLPQDSFIVLSAGTLNKNKNHETIIRAIAKINNRDIHYVICGVGANENYLKNLSIELGLKGKVHLLGYRHDIANIYKISDVYAFPSFREGLGMSALEAMASGLPIITSNVHGIKDYSIHGKTGFMYSPEDIDGFSKGLYHLLNDRNLIIRMGEYNKEIVERYNMKNAIKAMENIYKKIIK